MERLAFVKIDVEGFEYEVIKGGENVLSRTDAPTIHFEVNRACMQHRHMDPNQIVALLKTYGYREFLQVRRYGGVKRAPSRLPAANCDYLAFKDSDFAARVLGG